MVSTPTTPVIGSKILSRKLKIYELAEFDDRSDTSISTVLLDSVIHDGVDAIIM